MNVKRFDMDTITLISFFFLFTLLYFNRRSKGKIFLRWVFVWKTKIILNVWLERSIYNIIKKNRLKKLNLEKKIFFDQHETWTRDLQICSLHRYHGTTATVSNTVENNIGNSFSTHWFESHVSIENFKLFNSKKF